MTWNYLIDRVKTSHPDMIHGIYDSEVRFSTIDTTTVPQPSLATNFGTNNGASTSTTSSTFTPFSVTRKSRTGVVVQFKPRGETLVTKTEK